MRLTGCDRTAEKSAGTAAQSPSPFSGRQKAILCPDDNSIELMQTVEQLRSDGEVVIVDLAGLNQSLCDRVIRRKDDTWLVENL